MAQKSIGYIQLVWTCPNCKTKNLGSLRSCTNCGAPMPKDVVFEQPIKEDLVENQEEIAAAKSGADIYCAFCGNRNPGNAETCSNCGAALAEGTARKSAGAYRVADAPVPETIQCAVCGTENPIDRLTCGSCGSPLNTTQKIAQPDPFANQPPKTQKMGKGCIVAGLLILIALFAAFYLLFIKTNSGTAQVTGTAWTTQVEILGLVNRQASDWEDSIPSSGNITSCSSRARSKSNNYVAGSKEECGAPYYVDKGNGYSEKVQDCQYVIYDSYCNYTYRDWGVINVVREQGTDQTPFYAETALQSNQRLGNRSAGYQVQLTSADGKIFEYSPSSLSEYQSFNLNDEFMIEVNNMGAIVKLEKK